LTSSQSLISLTNNLTDGGNSSTFYANTNIQIGGDLTVTGNITLETVGYDNLEVSGDLNVVGNTTVNNIFASGAGFSQNANVKSGVTTLTNFSSTSTDTDVINSPSPLTASVSIAVQSIPTKTVTMTLIVKNITDNTTLSTQGPTGFTTVGTGFTYQWVGNPAKTYEVTASASNT
jgi:hypothetical protein